MSLSHLAANKSGIKPEAMNMDEVKRVDVLIEERPELRGETPVIEKSGLEWVDVSSIEGWFDLFLESIAEVGD